MVSVFLGTVTNQSLGLVKTFILWGNMFVCTSDQPNVEMCTVNQATTIMCGSNKKNCPKAQKVKRKKLLSCLLF